MSEPTNLVQFDNAPVVEMLAGLYFTRVAGWDLLDFGLLWQKLVSRYSQHEFKTPIVGDVAQLGQIAAALQKQDLGNFPVRCWYIDNEQAQLLQVQDNCVIHNWRKVQNAEAYPGYDQIRSRFAEDWRIFCAFLKERGLDRPDVWKCDITYIDHFERGSEWKNFTDLPKIYRLWRGMEAEGTLSNLEFAAFSVNYALADGKIRLLFSSQPTVRATDGKEVIQLTVTATGRPASSDLGDILSWLDVGHKALIHGFIDFTTPEIQDYWRRTK